MRFHRFALITVLVLGGSTSLFACTGDDNSLPLPPADGGASDAKASDASSDATTEKGDAAKDGEAEDGSTAPGSDASDASNEVPDATGDAPADAPSDAEVVPETGATSLDAAPDGESLDAADNGG